MWLLELQELTAQGDKVILYITFTGSICFEMMCTTNIEVWWLIGCVRCLWCGKLLV